MPFPDSAVQKSPKSVVEILTTFKKYKIVAQCYLISARRPDVVIVNKKKKKRKKKKSWIVGFAVPDGYRVKLQENKRKNKNLDLSRDHKTPWNMKVMVIPILIDTLGTIT